MASHQHQTLLQEAWFIKGSFQANAHPILGEINSYDSFSLVRWSVLSILNACVESSTLKEGEENHGHGVKVEVEMRIFIGK